MSADNWAVCPACKKLADVEHERLVAQIPLSYGKVPIEVFDEMRARAADGVKLENTFREDYEFYIDGEGVVHAHYKGHCTACGAHIEFHHTAQMEMPE